MRQPRERAGGGRGSLARASGVALIAGLALAGCGAEASKPSLTWYVNPDGVATLTALAENCSTEEYDVRVEQLPTSATDQRTQLARRLAAEDDSTDLMSLDPVFVPEFANAGWLAELPEEMASEAAGENVLGGAAETVQWEDGVYAFPQWANTQVLWYRKSLAEAAGLDMSEPVTWSELIEAAANNNGSVGIQADRYEGYVVWINALIQGAGGNIVENTEAGTDADVTIDSEAGRAAAAVVQQLAESDAAHPDLTVSNEGTVLGRMYPGDESAPQGAGEFMVNWTFVYKNYEPSDANNFTEEQFNDLGWARYPATVEGEQSKPPIGGIDIGVGAFTDHPDFAMEAAQCVTNQEAQVQLAVNEGLMPATNSAYEAEQLVADFPADLLQLYRDSVDTGGPRPKSAYYATISNAIQSTWHSPDAVDPETTPQESAEFLSAVLEGRRLL